jgi:hypothetical protein
MRALSLLLGLVPLLGLVELGLHHHFAERAPRFEDYARLAPRLLELKRSGQPVVVAPFWAEPLVRQAAAEAFPLPELARMEDRGFSSFLEVSLLGASAPELAEFPISERRRVGVFELRIHRNPAPEPPRYDFVDAVESGAAEVFTELDGQRTPCEQATRPHTSSGGLHGHVAYPRQRYECAGGRLVGVTLIEDETYRPRRCVLAQPPTRGKLWLRFQGVPASKRLVGYGGFSYFLNRDGGDSLELSVSDGQAPLGVRRISPERGWAGFAFARKGGATGVVEIALQAEQHQPNDACFALEAR